MTLPKSTTASTGASSSSPRLTRGGWSRAHISAERAASAGNDWLIQALDHQLPLQFYPRTLLMVGGRGAGKTRAGAEWVEALVRGLPPCTPRGLRHGSFALVGETLADVREVMVEGPSGILRLPRRPGWDAPRLEIGRRRLVWSNGATAQMFSSDEPDRLRGPQFDAAWCDELAKWRNAEETFDMLQFGLRLGDNPRQAITTTPRATALVKRLFADPQVMRLHGRTADNTHLRAGFQDAIAARYGGIRLGRQELDGELIEDREGAMWARAAVEGCFVGERPALRRIVVAVDPPASSGRTSDACGIVAAGLDDEGRVFVLADETRRAAKPVDWARAAVSLYHRLEADCIVAEVNQGGEMVTAVIRMVDADVPVKAVRATRGKWVRAEPVAALYGQGRVKHAGRFAELEDEMCDFGPDGLSGGGSPDRLDALVWAVSELALRERAEPRIRQL